MMLVERDLNDYVTDRFDALVVLPERSNAQLEEAWRRVLALTAETDAQLRRDRLEHLRFAVDRMALDDGRPAARTLVLDDANPAGALLAGAGVTGAYGLYAVLNVGCFLFVRRRVVETARRPLAEARAAVANS